MVLLVVVAAEQETYMMIDQEEAAHTQEVVAHPRVERGAEEEGSGGLLGNHFADYGIDDEDQVTIPDMTTKFSCWGSFDHIE